MKSWKAELWLFFITFIWGGTFVFTKLGLEDCPPSLYIIIRFSIALIISIIVFGKHLRNISANTLKHGLILGLLFGSGFILQTYGLKMTTVSKSAFITGLTVCITPFAYYFVERKSIALWQKAGVVIATIGLWLFTNPQFDNLNFGDIITVVSTFFWAFYITYMDVFTRGRSVFSETVQLVALQFIAAAPLAGITFFIYDSSDFTVNISKNLIYSLAYNGILASFLLTFIHTSIQRYSTPVKAALIFSLEPVIASVAAVLFIGEILGLRELAGGAILFIGVITSEVGEFIINFPKRFRKT